MITPLDPRLARNRLTNDMSTMAHAAVVLMLAVALDRLLPEPPHSIHPVVWMGRVVKALERIAPRSPALSALFGVFIVLAVVGGSGLAAWWAVSTLTSWGDAAYLVGGALMLRTTFTVSGLSEAARKIQTPLQNGQPEKARAHLRNLVGRDPALLTPSLMAGATIESVAENTTDSFIGPWMAFALFGVPGAVAYRAINTLDSMIGYRGTYEYLGKASARLDDLINLIPARISALLLLTSGALSRLPAGSAWRTMRGDHRLTASPNAGWTIGVMAGLLETRLEKPNHYCLGSNFNQPTSADIARAVDVVAQAAGLAVVATLGVLAVKLAVTG